MIEEKDSPFLYLDRGDIERIHSFLAQWATHEGEPIPAFSLAQKDGIDTLIDGPRQRFFGKDAYETIEEKAAFLFYSINKRQIFLNGNKRMSTLCLLVFLSINNRTLDVTPDQLTEKALWLANTDSLDFPTVKKELVAWIQQHSHQSS